MRGEIRSAIGLPGPEAMVGLVSSDRLLVVGAGHVIDWSERKLFRSPFGTFVQDVEVQGQGTTLKVSPFIRNQPFPFIETSTRIVWNGGNVVD